MINLPKKIFNFWHILKAKTILLYALLYHVPDACLGIYKGYVSKILTGYILDLIFSPVIRFRPYCRFSMELKRKRGFSRRQIRYFKEAWNVLYRDFFNEYTRHRKTSLANYTYVEIDPPALGSYFSRIVGAAWFCEKLNLNIKFTFPQTYPTGNTNFFENSILAYSKECQNEKFMQLKKPIIDLDYRTPIRPCIWEFFAKRKISSRFGYNILTKLSIKQDIRLQADQWWRTNTKQQQYIGVHYRQTDVTEEKRVIAIESYIEYLKEVLDNRYGILACSDNIQFINIIHKEFPGKVISRDITRSNDRRSLHRHEPYAGDQQRQDALIDILTLAKTEVIYTVGSYMIDMIRFFNPSIKIISLDKRSWWLCKNNISNYLPIPHAHRIKEYQEEVAWKKTILEKEKPLHIEVKSE